MSKLITQIKKTYDVALAGNPNCGKTALFNAITGGNAKVGNYPGVTVERKVGRALLPDGSTLKVLDLPGTYSLNSRTLDEEITRNILLGKHALEPMPKALIAVVDATNLERGLGFVLELRELGIPLVLALNMVDLAKSRGQVLNLEILSRELGIPVVPTVAIQKEGLEKLLAEVCLLKSDLKPAVLIDWKKPDQNQIRSRFAEVDRILSLSIVQATQPALWTERLDQIVLHPVLGTCLLVLVLAFVFQAIFSWAEIPKGFIESGVSWLGDQVGLWLGKGPLESLIVDGMIAGVGAVLVFLPQILILFAFILVLEDSGYMARAAFLMDKLMGKVGLHGRAFIPLLSSFACAIPGIMSTRTIEQRKDRLTTILVAPLMTCSARLPVYSLLIAAFIPNMSVWGPIRLQGLVMFGLYFAGVVIALLMAVIFRMSLFRGPKPNLLMELPTYKLPRLKNIGLGLMERSVLFLKKAGTVILSVSIVLWFLVSYPKAPVGAHEAAISYSYAGIVGHAIEPLFRPLGFNWKIVVALIPGLAAREVMIGSLATVYAVEGRENGIALLGQRLSEDWSIATALSLLVWYVLACQCFSTLAVTRRETNSWRWPAFMFLYMTSLAYLGSFTIYHLAVKMGLGKI
ncbi:MAG: ferrous iron transporter B [Bdellovibrionia bacterium]